MRSYLVALVVVQLLRAERLFVSMSQGGCG